MQNKKRMTRKLGQRQKTRRSSEAADTVSPPSYPISLHSLPIPIPPSVPPRDLPTTLDVFDSANHRDSRNAFLKLLEAKREYTAELKLAGLPKTFGPYGKRCLTALKGVQRKKQMAEVAVRGWQAFEKADKHAESGEWDEAVNAAIAFGACIGELRVLNKIGAANRLKIGEPTRRQRAKLALDEAFIQFANSPQNSKQKFDAWSASESGVSEDFAGLNPKAQSNVLADWRASLPKDADLKSVAGRLELSQRLKAWRTSQRYPLASQSAT